MNSNSLFNDFVIRQPLVERRYDFLFHALESFDIARWNTSEHDLIHACVCELDYPLDPSRTGAVADECPGLTADAVADALLAELARERDLEFVEIGEATRAAAAPPPGVGVAAARDSAKSRPDSVSG